MTFVKLTHKQTGAHRWVIPELVPAQGPEWEGGTVNLLDRIDTVLAEAEGFVAWAGSTDAMVATFREPTSPSLRIGGRQAAALRWIWHHPRCSGTAALQAAGFPRPGGFAYYQVLWAMDRRGLIEIGRGWSGLEITITPEGIEALRQNAARVGWVTGDPIGRAS